MNPLPKSWLGQCLCGLSQCQHPPHSSSLALKRLTRPWPVLRKALDLVPVPGGDNYPDVHLQSLNTSSWRWKHRFGCGELGVEALSLPWLSLSGRAVSANDGLGCPHQACLGPCSLDLLLGGATTVPLPLPAARPTGSLRGRELDTVGDRTEGWGLESLALVPHLCGGAAEHLQVPEATAPISVKTVSWASQTQPLSSGTEPSKQAADGHQEPRWSSNGIHTALQIPFKPANTSQKLGSPTGNGDW